MDSLFQSAIQRFDNDVTKHFFQTFSILLIC